MHALIWPRRIRITLLLLVAAAAAVLATGGCGKSIPEPGSTLAPPSAEVDQPTPAATDTPSPTPTPAPIPAPEGFWSSYWNSNFVSDLLLDGDGYLWALGSGIVRWDPADGTYTEFGVEDGLPANVANAMFLGPKKTVWFSFDGYGFWHLDGSEWVYELEEGEVEGTRLYASAVGKNGVLWVCTDEGFSNFDGQEWTSIHQDGGLDPGLCKYITVDRDGNAWLQGTLGITTIFPDHIEYQEFEDVEIDTSDPIGAHTAPNGDLWFAYGKDHIIQYDVSEGKWFAERQRPTAFALTSNGQPWIIDDWGGMTRPDNLQTFEYGIYPIGDFLAGGKLKLVSGYRWHIPFNNETPSSLYDLYPGLNKEMWVRTSAGLLLIRGDKFELLPLKDTPIDLEPFGRGKAYLAVQGGIAVFSGGEVVDRLQIESPLLTNSITELAVDREGRLWIGTFAGLQTFDGVTWTTHDLPGSWVYDLRMAPNGDIWVSLGRSGFARWDGAGWEHFKRGEVEGLPDERADEIFIAGDGTVWVAFADAGVASFDGANWTFHAFPGEQVPSFIHDLTVDTAGTVHVAADEALYSLQGETWTVKQLEIDILAMFAGPNGTIWVGTSEDGVYKLVEGKLVPTDYPSEAARYFALSPDGSLWVASLDGAWRFDGYQWHAYTVEDGLRTNRPRSVGAGPDGTIWFGGDGLTRFGPARKEIQTGRCPC